VRSITKNEGETSERRLEELCPPETSDEDALDVEPPGDPSILPCWGSFVGRTSRSLVTETDPDALARAILATAERTHRSGLTASAVETRRKRVALTSS